MRADLARRKSLSLLANSSAFRCADSRPSWRGWPWASGSPRYCPRRHSLHISVKIDPATLPADVGIVFVPSFQQTQALVRDQKPDTLQTPVLKVPKNRASFPGLPSSPRHTKNFEIPCLIHADSHQVRYPFDFAPHARLSQMRPIKT